MRYAAILPLFLLSALCAGEYTVKMERRLKAGDTVTIVSKGRKNTVKNYAKDGKVYSSSTEKFEVSLDGECTILAVNTAGVETLEDFSISKCEKSENGETTVLLAPGTLLRIDRSGEKTRLLNKNGTEVAADVKRALEAIIPPEPASNDFSIDKMFPAKGPRKVGDEWPMDADFCRDSWSKVGGEVNYSKGKISGAATLKSVSKENGADALLVSMSIAVDMKEGNPPGVEVEKWMLNGVYEGIVPADIEQPLIGVSRKWQVQCVGTLPDPNGGRIHMDITSDESSEKTLIHKRAK